MKSLSVKPLLFTVVLALLNGAIVKVAAFRSDASLAIKARSSTRVYSTGSTTEQHPAVQGWPEKYTGTPTSDVGPRVLHEGFFVEKATDHTLNELDVLNWPIWTTSDKPKWAVGNQNADKVMPYSELSYVIKGKLEIIPPSGEKVIIKEGDFVTFPEGFKSSWRVLEELTWHYYLY